MSSRKTPTPVPSLPDDLMLSCLARVSRLHYQSLSLVSKRFGSFIASPELYKTRSLLGRSESCLYVCLDIGKQTQTSWFTLCRKPDRTLTSKSKKKKKKKSSGNVLVQIPSPPICPSSLSCIVSLGSNIYKIGGPVEHQPSTSVSILDCRSHTWSEAPSLVMERMCPCAGVLDGKIYVAGGCQDSMNAIEVFDPKTLIWDLVPMNWELNPSGAPRFACVDGKLHLLIGEESRAYDPEERRWDLVQGDLSQTRTPCYCVIDNVCYKYYEGEFKWYDTKARLWKQLKGLVGLPKIAPHISHVRLADYGGKMVVLWVKNSHSSGSKKMVWCAEISLERHDGDEIWGMVECFDHVLPVADSFIFVKVLAATL